MINAMSIRSEVITQITLVAEEQNRALAPLKDDLPLLDSGLDSLCLAVVIARLEDLLGVDPFSSSADTPFPVTVGDLVSSYEHAVQ
jgi:acyl carrier protein